jgi:Flp pilus assembly protein TadD
MATGDTARTLLGGIFHFVTWPLFFVGGFVADWFSTRNWSWFFVSIPALLVGGLVMVGFVRAQWSSDEGLSASYAKRASAAYKNEEYARAEMMYRKAIKYRPQENSLKFARAFVLDKLDRPNDAFMLMQSIAPIERDSEEKTRNGYVDAHLWIAKALLIQHVKTENPLPMAESHLRAIISQNPEHIEAHRMLTDLAISVRNGNAAIEHISHIVDTYPDTRIIYARLLDSANRKEEAKKEAGRAFNYYQREIPAKLADPKKTPKAADWLNWASSAMILDRFNDAIKILKDASKHSEEKKLIRQGLAGVLVRWTQRLDEIEEPNIRQQLELLGEALRIAPDNPAVLERVALLIGRDEGSDAVAEEMLKDALVKGTAPAIVHFLLGTRAAANEQDSEQAETYLKQALLLNPNTPVVLNNLAWVMASRGTEKELRDGLKLADQAVKLKKHQPNFRDTRGQIHIKLGNWRQGIADLEEAQRKMKDNPEIHKSLALAYEKIGNADFATRHRKLYNEIIAANEAKKAKEDAAAGAQDNG